MKRASAPGPVPEILYEDNHLIAVFKPAGTLTQGDATGDPSMMDEVREHIRLRDRKPGNVFLGLVHRLDRPVSGVLLLAKTSKGASRIAAQIRNREVTKTYRALTQGQPPPGPGATLRHLLLAAAPGGSSRVVDAPEKDAKVAALEYRVLQRLPGMALLEIDLHTGRKHQIRAQLAHIGCPILGDVRYGATAPFHPGTIALVARRLRGPPASFQRPDHHRSPRPPLPPHHLATNPKHRPASGAVDSVSEIPNARKGSPLSTFGASRRRSR